MSVGSEATEVQEQSALKAALMPNAGYARLWKLMAGIFLLAGLLALLERVWVLTADVHARRTWPVAAGVIVSAQQQDDAETPGRLRGHTRYWVEYEVRFAVPAGQCRTGIIYEGAAEPMPCGGIVRTRSTQSTAEVYQWFLHGYHPNEPVKVLWNPEGVTSSEIKIAGESIWIRYNFGRLIFSLVWVLGFGSLYVYCKRQVTYFGSHPEEERSSQQSTAPGVAGDNDQLTDLDLS
jgi:hypothetical protein